jgi:hypothetical protein
MSYISEGHFFAVINSGNRGFTLSHNIVIHDVVGQHTNVYKVEDQGRVITVKIIAKSKNASKYVQRFGGAVWNQRCGTRIPFWCALGSTALDIDS